MHLKHEKQQIRRKAFNTIQSSLNFPKPNLLQRYKQQTKAHSDLTENAGSKKWTCDHPRLARRVADGGRDGHRRTGSLPHLLAYNVGRRDSSWCRLLSQPHLARRVADGGRDGHRRGCGVVGAGESSALWYKAGSLPHLLAYHVGRRDSSWCRLLSQPVKRWPAVETSGRLWTVCTTTGWPRF